MTQAQTMAMALLECPYRDVHHPSGNHPSIIHNDYPGWGSACLAWALEQIKQAGGKRYSGGGFLFDDASVLFATWEEDPHPDPEYMYPPHLQVWHATDQVARPPIPLAPPNDYGITNLSGWSDLEMRAPLKEQLVKQGIEHEVIPITHLVGTAGCAYLLIYTSPKTGQPVTVLVIPQADIDSWAESYFHCVGMTREAAVRRSEDDWIRAYDETRKWR